jgi:phosphonate dehydrogenase
MSLPWRIARGTRRPAIPTELLEHRRSVFTPHLGWAVAEVRRAIETHAAESIVQALDGEHPAGAINDL